MGRPAILLNPVVRVWNLRFLLLCILAIVVWWPLPGSNDEVYGHFTVLDLGKVLNVGQIVICCCLGLVHHTLVLVQWQLKGLALIDLSVTLVEIGGLIYLTLNVALFLPPLISLIFSALCRIATIRNSREPMFYQHFRFLGSCARADPSYTLLRIFLGRSIARPLVRGESRVIVFTRALIITAVAIGMPAFGVYSIIIAPLNSQISIRSLRVEGFTEISWGGNANVVLTDLYGTLMDPATLQTQMRATLSDGPSGEEITCGSKARILECPCMWDEILNVSISLVIPSHTAGVFVVPALDNFVPGESGVHTLGAVLFPGSNLIGGFTWTRRDLLRPPSSFALAGEYATTTVYTPDIIGLQDIPGSAMAAGAAALKLYQLSPWLTRVLQDTLDTTALTGVGTFGGVWTFLNGAFAFLFGANVFYFLLRRRPLSALGVLHIFQRRRLVRQWHEDFPAIHTEGGRPGSNSAGIVVFIRERLVDLDEEIEAGDDIEAQFPKGEEIITTDTAMPVNETREHSRIYPNPIPEPRYILDAIPLLDADLGMGTILTEPED